MATPWQSRDPIWLSRGNPEAQMANPWQSKGVGGGIWLSRGNLKLQMATPWQSRGADGYPVAIPRPRWPP
eukprot:4198812-Pyramimonas_sp.AAC.1